MWKLEISYWRDIRSIYLIDYIYKMLKEKNVIMSICDKKKGVKFLWDWFMIYRIEFFRIECDNQLEFIVSFNQSDFILNLW